MSTQKLEIKHCRGFIQAFLLRSVFVMKIRFLWPEVLEGGGPEKRCDRPCVGSRANTIVGPGYFTIYLYGPCSLFCKK